MKNNGSQKCAGSFRHPGKHDAKQGSIYPLHQVPMVNAENHAGKYHGNRRAEYLFGFPIDNSPEYQFLGKRRCKSIQADSQPQRYGGLFLCHLLKGLGMLCQTEISDDNVKPQGQGGRQENKGRNPFPVRPFPEPEIQGRSPDRQAGQASCQCHEQVCHASCQAAVYRSRIHAARASAIAKQKPRQHQPCRLAGFIYQKCRYY